MSKIRNTVHNRNKHSLEDMHLLCVEPGSKRLFQINIGTQEAEEVKLKQDRAIDNKIKREEYKMDTLLNRPEHNDHWFFQNDAVNNFRRQMVPFYLLEVESNQYPVYIDNSNLDASLTEDYTIKNIHIGMSDSILYAAQLDYNKVKRAAPSSYKGGRRPISKVSEPNPIITHGNAGNKRPQMIDMVEITNITLTDIPLLTTAKQLIQICERKVEKQLDRQFEDPDRYQILKFKNVDSYLSGDTQLVYFVEVRKFLRSKTEKLELVFLSYSKNEKKESLRDGHNADAGTQNEKKTPNYEFPPLLSINPQSNYTAGGSNPHSRKRTRVDGLGGRAESVLVQKGRTPTSEVKHGVTGLERRRTSHNRPDRQPKPIEDSMASRYKHVSLFGWYTPNNFSKLMRQNRKMIDHRPSDANLDSGTSKISYHQVDSQLFSLKKMQEGNISFMRAPKTGRGSPFLPYTAENEILRSCDIFTPLKINLIGVRQLAQILQKQVGTHNPPQKIAKMSYVVPQGKTANQAVDDLLADCYRLGNRMNMAAKKDMQAAIRSNLTNPYGNRGTNAYYVQGFQAIQFILQNNVGKKKEEPFSMIPKYVQVQAALYLGCRRISCFSYSKPTLYGNEIDFGGDFLKFYKPRFCNVLKKQQEQEDDVLSMEIRGERIKINCLPSCARLCMNIIVLPEPGSAKCLKKEYNVSVNYDNYYTVKDLKTNEEAQHKETREAKFIRKEGLVFGSCQVSLFDENFLLRQGRKDMRLWPFEQYQPRMVCQGECYIKELPKQKLDKQNKWEAMSVQIEFMSFSGKVGWRLKASSKPMQAPVLKNDQLNKQQTMVNELQQKKDKKQVNETDLEASTSILRQVKKLLDVYPMELKASEAENIEVQKVIEQNNYIYKLPVFIRLIDFTDHQQIRLCYDTLDASGLAKDMLPEEALALLDGEFGDIKVRIFAVQKLAMLNDSQIALFMPQLVQALKYELFHHSPLAEFLLEKALSNTRVVGHAFYWALKASLARPKDEEIPMSPKEKAKERRRIDKRLGPFRQCEERFFLILERFLMCCGQFKNELFKQNLVNESFVKLSAYVNRQFTDKDMTKSRVKILMHEQIKKEEIKIKLMQQLVIAHARYDDRHIYSTREGGGDSSRLLGAREKSHFVQKRAPGKSAYRKKTVAGGPVIKDLYTFNINEIVDFIKYKSEEIFESIQAGVDHPDIKYRQLINVDWNLELMYLPFAPKEPIASFAKDGGTIFMSKKKPLMIVCNLANEKESEAALKAQNANRMIKQDDEIQENAENHLLDGRQRMAIDSQKVMISDEKRDQKRVMWKSGDDLRQDNLVLQFFKIMDRLWQSAGYDLAMECYDVFESGFEIGYIEFVNPSTVITDMHKEFGYRGPFKEHSIMSYFMNQIAVKDQFTLARDSKAVRRRLDNFHSQFMRSLAGQCVATYVLGIRDRHPGNFMLKTDTGQFLHIDFGHFLGHGKIKAGFLRDREPFILSDELQYFLKYFGEISIELADASNQEKPKETLPDEEEDAQSFSVTKSQIMNKDQLAQEPQFKFKLSFTDPRKKKKKRDKENKKYIPPEEHEEKFDELCISAFLVIRKNADIFINLLVLMIVCDLEELDQPSIEFIKEQLFLNVSEEEATVMFRGQIAEARKQWYRPWDNLAHIISDNRKAAKLAKKERKAGNKKTKSPAEQLRSHQQ